VVLSSLNWEGMTEQSLHQLLPNMSVLDPDPDLANNDSTQYLMMTVGNDLSNSWAAVRLDRLCFTCLRNTCACCSGSVALQGTERRHEAVHLSGVVIGCFRKLGGGAVSSSQSCS
jgi:hypothetical protein